MTERAVLWRCKNGRWQESFLHNGPGDPAELEKFADDYNAQAEQAGLVVRYAVFPAGVDPNAP